MVAAAIPVGRVRPAASHRHCVPPSCARSLTPPSPIRAPIPHRPTPTPSLATIHSASTRPTLPSHNHLSRPSTAAHPIRTHPRGHSVHHHHCRWSGHRLPWSAEDTIAGRTHMLQMHVSSVSDIFRSMLQLFHLNIAKVN
jgi:hypothetical protein